MARPLKKGLDYFPFDVGFFDDRKIKELRGKFGADGITLYIYLLCQIYNENGYYLKLDDGFNYVASADLQMSSEKIGQIINFLCERSLFDNKLFVSDKVLTSPGIQTRYQEAVQKRAERREIEVGEYWLLEQDETKSYIKCRKNEGLWGKNEGLCTHKHGKSTHKPHKAKESKVNKSKVKKSSDAAAGIFERYEKMTGLTVSRTMMTDVDSFISGGTEPELICAVIDYAVDSGKGNWNYIRGTLNGISREGVKTKAEYERRRAARKNKTAAPSAKSFNNVSARGGNDYSAIEDKIIDMMMEGE